MHYGKIRSALVAAIVIAFSQISLAAGQSEETEDLLVIPPLFEYVIAPDDLPDLQSRTDYLMENFWKPFDFKQNKTVDQNALNHAFGVYVQAMPYASQDKVQESVKKLIANIKNNPGLSYQFVKAAEESLYGPRAEYWVDDLYIAFLRNLKENKKIDESKKRKYIAQLDLLERTSRGAETPAFRYADSNGVVKQFKPVKRYTLVEFTDPESDEFRYTNLKLDISGTANDLLEDDSLEVLVLLPEGKTTPDFPSKWNSGIYKDTTDMMDVRMMPCFYLIDGQNKIAGKNLTVDAALQLLDELRQQN